MDDHQKPTVQSQKAIVQYKTGIVMCQKSLVRCHRYAKSGGSINRLLSKVSSRMFSRVSRLKTDNNESFTHQFGSDYFKANPRFDQVGQNDTRTYKRIEFN